MNRTTKAAGIAAVALAGYDTLVRPRMVNWGASSDEQRMQLPGDDIASGMPPDYTKAVTIQAPPEAGRAGAGSAGPSALVAACRQTILGAWNRSGEGVGPAEAGLRQPRVVAGRPLL